MEVLKLGHAFLVIAAIALAAVWVLSLVGALVKSRRCVLSARVGFYAVFVLVLGASATLVYGFIAGCYNNEYIWGHSDSELPFFFRFAGLWAGLEGSLLFWTLLLAGVSAIAALQHRWSSRHPSGRRMEPWVYFVLSSVLGFFVALTVKQNPFVEFDAKEIAHFAWAYNLPISHEGLLTQGRGLNPQLVNYWFVFHPPTLYLGMVTFAVPFAFGMAALISRELGDYWIRVTRRWAMVAWVCLTCGVILGGLWAYRQLGWGGYWAWDPVENASFLPWCAATAFLHSIMIQERRDILKWWNVFLLIFAFFLTIEATYMTRAGEVDSVHAFAGGSDIGTWFRCFKWMIVGSGLFLLFLRFRDLKGSHRLESLLSRESAFFFNNLILVVLAVAIWTMSWWPNLTESYAARKEKFEIADFNEYMVPLLLALVALTALGPSLGWVKTSGKALRRNLLGPAVFALLMLAASYGLIAWLQPDKLSLETVFVPKFVHDWIWPKESGDVFFSAGLYPTGLFLFFGFLIFATVGAELHRGVKSRRKHRGEDILTAFLTLFTRDNRRWGGYVVHIGVALLVVGITVSSMFKTSEEKLFVKMGEYTRIGDYLITPVTANRSWAEINDAEKKVKAKTHRVEDFEDGLSYLRDRVLFRVYHSPKKDSGDPTLGRTAHAAGKSGNDARMRREAAKAGFDVVHETLSPEAELLYELEPERRYYPKQNQWINEVSVKRRFLGDIYIYYSNRFEGEWISLTAFLNPMMLLIWAGWGVMILGGLFAIVPFSGNRVGLSE